MRNVIYAINVTLDGCCDHTKMIADEATYEYVIRVIRDVDLLVFGRKTYQLMVPYWPDVAKDPSQSKADREFAQAFDSINKLVFSRSLDSAEDKSTRITRANLQDEMLKLKQEQGKNILVGGVALPSQLVELGLVDEFRFVVQPLVVGEGRRLLEGIDPQKRLQLKLVESKIFKSGSIALRYLKQRQKNLSHLLGMNGGDERLTFLWGLASERFLLAHVLGSVRLLEGIPGL